MTTLAPALAALAALTTLAATPTELASTATLFNAPADAFSALFPATVGLATQAVQTPHGSVQTRIYSARKNTGLYQVAVTILPPRNLEARTPQQILAAAQTGALRGVNANPEAEQQLFVQGAPARRFKVETNERQLAVHQFILHRGRLYHVLCVLPRQDVRLAVAFVRSFSLARRDAL